MFSNSTIIKKTKNTSGINYKPIDRALKNYNLNSREKFEPGRVDSSSNLGPGSNVPLEFKLVLTHLRGQMKAYN